MVSAICSKRLGNQLKSQSVADTEWATAMRAGVKAQGLGRQARALLDHGAHPGASGRRLRAGRPISKVAAWHRIAAGRPPGCRTPAFQAPRAFCSAQGCESACCRRRMCDLAGLCVNLAARTRGAQRCVCSSIPALALSPRGGNGRPCCNSGRAASSLHGVPVCMLLQSLAAPLPPAAPCAAAAARRVSCAGTDKGKRRELAATGRLQAASSSSHAGVKLEAGRGCPKAYQLLTVSSQAGGGRSMGRGAADEQHRETSWRDHIISDHGCVQAVRRCLLCDASPGLHACEELDHTFS